MARNSRPGRNRRPSASTLGLLNGCASFACLAPLVSTPAVGTPSPLGGSAVVVLEPVPAAHARATISRRLVFTCVEPGLVTFADRPCGSMPQRREIEVTAPASFGVPGSTAPSEAAHRARSQSGPPLRADVSGQPREEAQSPPRDLHAETCERLQAAVRTLDDRMRAGYTAREAARLWSRWREARERVREAGCRA